MSKNNKKRRIELSGPIKTIVGISISCLIGIITSLLLSIFFSYILSKSPEISSFVSVYFVISVLLGVFISGFLGSKLLQFKGLISGLICSIPYSLTTIFIMLFASNGQLSPFVAILLIFIMIFGIIGGITSANMKRRK